jgi:hypothetical protein
MCNNDEFAACADTPRSHVRTTTSPVCSHTQPPRTSQRDCRLRRRRHRRQRRLVMMPPQHRRELRVRRTCLLTLLHRWGRPAGLLPPPLAPSQRRYHLFLIGGAHSRPPTKAPTVQPPAASQQRPMTTAERQRGVASQGLRRLLSFISVGATGSSSCKACWKERGGSASQRAPLAEQARNSSSSGASDRRILISHISERAGR